MVSLTQVRWSEEREQLRAKYHLLLAKTAELLLPDSSPEVLCQNIFDVLRDSFQLDFYFYFLVSEDDTSLELESAGGSEELRDGIGSHLEFGEAITGVVALTQQEEYLENLQQRDDEMTRVARALGVRCYLCQPIIAKDRLIGTLSFGSKRRDFFFADELRLLRLVAQQVAHAADRGLNAKKMLQLERLAVAGRMAATLAHEINNPLQSLANLLFLLRYEVLGEEGRVLVSAAEKAVSLLAETTQRTLDVCRGKQHTAVILSLSDLVAEILTDVSLPEHVPLRSSIAAGITVKAIPGELRQVIFNLMINAAQFSPVGGEVTVTVDHAGPFAEIRVKDEGAGISEKAKARIFQPFYTTRTIGGTGLGLWLSRVMVERVCGTLTFNSEPALRPGTEFIIRLPLVEGAHSANTASK